MTEVLSETTRLRDQIAAVGKSLFDRGLTSGATGNISVRLDDGSMLMTPTNISLGELEPNRLSHVAADGHLLSGDRPTKEAFLHSCMYCKRASDRAVVHLHCTHAVGVSLLEGIDPENVLPPLTAYYVMRVGRLPLVSYYAPGDRDLAHAVQEMAGRHHAVLLANHGPVVSGVDLKTAQFAMEELEETAKLYLLMSQHPVRPLTAEQAAALEARTANAAGPLR
jgi:ribulose-5-phosphate 4-epimerase/fuculose-1-phosphate aldolase